MNRRILAVVAVVLIVAGIFAMSSLFIVDQTEEALVLQLGQPRRVIREPGLQVKRPFVENVIFYDNRLLDFEPPPEEVIVSDQKRLVVDTYTRYRITDPLLFYQTVSTEAAEQLTELQHRRGAQAELQRARAALQRLGGLGARLLREPDRHGLMRTLGQEIRPCRRTRV